MKSSARRANEHHSAPPPKKVNRLGLEVLNYKGSKTTLCAGCGHDSISERIVESFYEIGVEPDKVAKFSGIGCSSKSPAYFLEMSHGFNSVHGRMPAVATGADAGQSHLIGHRRHRRRRHSVDRPRPVHAHDPAQPADDLHHREQWRLRADQRPVLRDRRRRLHAKTGVVNDLPPFDCCALAMSGARLRRAVLQRRQEAASAILKTAISHDGLSVIDVISPCVTFNDHAGSTKSYGYMKEHEAVLHELDYVPFSRRSRSISRRGRRWTSSCTTARRCASGRSTATTIRPTAARRWRLSKRRRRKGRSLQVFCM